jgi:hypothetical protein
MGRIVKLLAVVLLLVVGTFVLVLYRRSLPPELKNYRGLAGVSSNDVLSVKMERMAEQAALDAWSRCHIEVHIGVHSLPDFERYLDLVSKSAWFKNFSPEDKQAEAIVDGAFVGEAIRRTHGGFWLEKSDLPGGGVFPLNIGGRINFPVTWCLKRLVNGPEDNVYDKYVFLVLRRTNEFHGEATYWTNTGKELKQLTNVIIP